MGIEFWILKICLIIFVGSNQVKSKDIFSSIEHLAKLPESKEKVIGHLRSFLLDQHEKLNDFEK